MSSQLGAVKNRITIAIEIIIRIRGISNFFIQVHFFRY
jgi:hypothetical protein